MKLETDLVVLNRQGIHLKSASSIVKTANRFQASLQLSIEDLCVDAKNAMEILLLAAGPDTRIHLVAEGPDAREATEALAKLFQEGFGEPI